MLFSLKSPVITSLPHQTTPSHQTSHVPTGLQATVPAVPSAWNVLPNFSTWQTNLTFRLTSNVPCHLRYFPSPCHHPHPWVKPVSAELPLHLTPRPHYPTLSTLAAGSWRKKHQRSQQQCSVSLPRHRGRSWALCPASEVIRPRFTGPWPFRHTVLASAQEPDSEITCLHISLRLSD